MLKQPETLASTQNNNDVIAITLRNRVSNQSNSNFLLSNEEVNDVAEQKSQIVNCILDSNDVHINNTNNNFYNAPVAIHHFYPQSDKPNDVSEKDADVPSRLDANKSFFHCKVEKCVQKKMTIVTFFLVIVITMLMIPLIVWSLTSRMTFEDPSDGCSSCNGSEFYRMRIVTREEWEAKPPRDRTDPLECLPPPYVIISDTQTALCYTQDQCTMIVQRIQNNHMKPWYDIAYNFLVGGDGLVYEGRGWAVEGAHTLYYNRLSIGISLIGTFKTEPPTKDQLRASEKLIEYGVERGHIASDYKLFTHRQVHDSDSPGWALSNIIKCWKHWTSNL